MVEKSEFRRYLVNVNSISAHHLFTGCGICDEGVVDLVVRRGPELVEQLLKWGTEFDLGENHIAATLEGGHSYPRVATAHGDETGRAMAEALIERARRHPNNTILE